MQSKKDNVVIDDNRLSCNTLGGLSMYQARHIMEELPNSNWERIMLTLKTLGSALAVFAVLSLGTYSSEAAAKPHGHHVSKHQQVKKNKLHPACKRYLERRSAWYRYKGNKAELRENLKATKAFRGLPYAEQKIQCQAAYQAFDDFDHGKFRRR